MTSSKFYLRAEPRRAWPIIAHASKPGNETLSNKQIARDMDTNEAYVRRAKSTYHWGETVKLDPGAIRMDGGTQPRERIDSDLVGEYSELIQGGVILPPVVTYYDGSNYWLADGFHRVLAALHARRKLMEVIVMMGTVREAILHSAGVNSEHGLRRTNQDKRRSAMVLLMDEEWGQRSDRWIAERCKLSNHFVSDLRKELLSVNGSQMEETRKCERNGTVYDIKVRGINAERKASPHGQTRNTTNRDGAMIAPATRPIDREHSAMTGGSPSIPPPIKANATPELVRPTREDARRDLIAATRDAWPELGDLLGGPRGAEIAHETLSRIVDDLRSHTN